MIPKKLTLEGIYSYQTRQTIDFTELTNAGLFGIFGAVASGKSTILEAVSFALYGDSERMGGTNKNYNMMNLKSDKMYIDFEFINFENKNYRFVREYRRNSKNFSEVKHHDTTFYELSDDAWIPLENVKTETIIGLSATNFKRTIIIPQGKFREFIELKGTDRTNMMKDIFNLHQFDLSNSVRVLYVDNEKKLDTLNGKISGYEEVSEEIIADKSKHFLEQNTFFNQQEAEHKKRLVVYEQLKELSSDFNKLQELQVKLASEEANKKQIGKSEESLKLYVTTHQEFDEILRLKEQLSQRLIKEEKTLAEIVNKLTKNQENSIIINEELSKRESFINAIDIKKEKIADLEFISQILTNKATIKEGEESTIKGRNYVGKLTKEKDELIETINNTDAEIEEIKAKLIDATTLASIEIWFSKHKDISKQIVDNKTKLNGLNKEISDIETKFLELGYQKDNWAEIIEKQNETISNQLEQANKQKSELGVKKEIAHFANKIHDGLPCPLCGSLEHPSVTETEDVSAEIMHNQTKLNELEHNSKLLIATNTELIKLQASESSIYKNIESVKTELKKLQDEAQHHNSLFVWDKFSPTDELAFKSKKALNDKLIIQKEQFEKRQRENRITLDKNNKQLAKASKRLDEIEKENSRLEILIESDINKIRHLLLEDYEHESIESVKNSIDERRLRIKKRRDEYADLEKQKNELLQIISAQVATKESTDKYITGLAQEQKENDAEIAVRMANTAFESLIEITELLSNKKDVEAERKRIENFRINYERLKQSMKELKERLEGKSFSPEEFEVESHKFEESEKAIGKLKVQLATLKYDLERLQKGYAEKKSLLIEKEKLENRKENITTLSQLFKASGFVNYVSSIYLKNLCAIANERFHRLTKNQLSLQMNDKNDFEIVDYLNNGRTRSVKTLSGGQSFQVSLSLALALAENVQSLTNSDKNFFFIDEGFGTQDAESVNIVFETLNNLQKENRIVGIISHVEELQERIPKSLFIKKDLEKGSIIEVVQ